MGERDLFTYHTDSFLEYLIPSVHKNMVKHAVSYTCEYQLMQHF